ncbi:bifunctional 2',3'-cyclic-nucleotide 2'-phosphodiesterase/3'-nucleotidase [candidate division KSB3 bacterium]|uniref:Bifunctional 2',3'-cyclic-nucleotide 2'-phosphodiesterase/3'-nucleotidase n=1 Tax=candidate division KSB3 bacterium TaxID=2044937 RepID=A0A2G6EBQ1_9BACT|nr:MAG: bifunctional 2',3'-cyclic-nucleotide 2'-phosphodiesterase/3'-nucleotidase [candidate division KSB3 bacterium]PIE30828.1 MAG: bifunctional 2',3'-cyclic-nucleotide 2'-phosphodiesterase/3'-nucleotidase [candidate division KSB3 bacterium]
MKTGRNRLTILLVLLFATTSSIAAAQTLKLRIMETTDIHVHLLNYDYYQDKESHTCGLVKTATLIGQARAEVTNSMLFDNGDLIQGNPLGDYVAMGRVLRFGEIHPVYKAMNLLGYDAGNIGNHEFNYGLDFLNKSLHGANFPYVVSNVYFDDQDNNPENDQLYFQPYVILSRTFTDDDGQDHVLQVGVIGFTPPQVMQWDQRHLSGKVITKDIVESAKKYVPEMLAKGADLIIAVPHSGLNPNPRKTMDENATYYLAEVPGIDVILFGHSHTVFPGKNFEGIEGVDNTKGTVHGVPAVMPGFWGSHLGIVDLTLAKRDAKWTVIDSQSEARPIFKREGREAIPVVEANPLIAAAVKQDHEETLAYVRRKVGETVAPINSFFALVQDDPSVQIVSIAQRWYVERIIQGTEYDGFPVLSAAAPFKAGGRGGPDYYTDVPAGDIALKNISDLYIYPNDLKVVLLTGAQVKEWLERSAGQFHQIDPASSEEQALINTAFPSYNFDVIDGLTYEIDVTQPSKYGPKGELVNPEASRIKNVTFNGNAIDEEQQFLVATNNYRAGGGGSFPALDGSTIVIDAPDKNRDIIANYLLTQGTINPSADDNWSFAPIGANVNVTFETSPKARSYIDSNDNMTFIRTDDRGFAIVKLAL